MRSLIRLLPLAVVVAVLLPAAPAQAGPCTPKRGLSVPSLLPFHYTYDYANCSVADLDQERTNLPNGGLMYCVPTATMDWMVWLAKFGWLVDPLPNLPFSTMTGYLIQMGQFMGTDPVGGTGDLIPGAQQFMDTYATGGVPTPFPGIVKIFVTGGDYGADPHAMSLDASLGGLVLVNVGFFDSTGTRTGGHEVALATANGDSNANTTNIGVRDPNTPGTVDGVQAPYLTEAWKLKRRSDGLWSVNGSTTTLFDGYSTIEPIRVFGTSSRAMSRSTSGSFSAGPGKGRATRIFRQAKATDFAIAPSGVVDPFIRAGSDAVWGLNRLGKRPVKIADGPAGPTAITYGGPAQTLFVAGRSRLIALDLKGKRIASVALHTRLDSLAYDDAHGRLVGVSSSARKVFFFSPSLGSLGSVALPAVQLGGKRTAPVTIDTTPQGGVIVHRSGLAQAAFAVPSAKPEGTTFQPLTLQGVSGPGGLAVTDHGQILVAAHGKVVVMDAQGKVVASALTGLRAIGGRMRVTRSFSNLPPGEKLDYLPPQFVGKPL
jgi:hypothetical protein